MNKDKSTACLIVCDGFVSKRLLDILLKKNERSSFAIISADGASNVLYRFKVNPDYIIGDLDSISPRTLLYYKNARVSIRKITEQQHNDMEKCISFALTKGMRFISVIGYGGKRIDHTINNFSILKKYYDKCNLRFVDDEFEVFMINKNTEFDYKIGEVISIMGFPKAEGIVTEGLQYALKNETLELGIREGALNKSISDNIKIHIKKGELIIFKKHFNNLTL